MPTMDRDRVGGMLMLAGGLLGLAGTVMTVFPFSPWRPSGSLPWEG